MEISIDWVYLVASAFAVIGDTQWVKSLIKAIKEKDGSWKYSVLVFIMAGLVACAGDGGINQILTNFSILLALVELGWELIVKVVLSFIKKLSGDNTSDIADKIIQKLQSIFPPSKGA